MKSKTNTLTVLTCSALLEMLGAGCTSTTVQAPGWSLKRTSLLQRIDMPELIISTNGTVTLRGYRTDGGSDLAAQVTAAAVSAAVKSAAP